MEAPQLPGYRAFAAASLYGMYNLPCPEETQVPGKCALTGTVEVGYSRGWQFVAAERLGMVCWLPARFAHRCLVLWSPRSGRPLVIAPAGRLQELVARCNAWSACQAVAFRPLGRGNVTQPLGLLKGTPDGGPIDPRRGNINSAGFLLVKESELPEGLSGSSGGGLSAGAIAGKISPAGQRSCSTCCCDQLPAYKLSSTMQL